MPELSTVYARAGEGQRGSNEVTEDTVGTIQFEFVDWRERRPACAIMDEIRDKTKDIPGVVIEVTKPQGRPADRQADQVQIAVASTRTACSRPPARPPRSCARSPTPATSTTACRCPASTGGSRSTRPRPPSTAPARRRSARRCSSSPTASRSPSTGRPTTDKPVDILLRFPRTGAASIEIDELRVKTPAGSVPIGNFVARVPAPKVGLINRVDGAARRHGDGERRRRRAERRRAAGGHRRRSPRPISAPASPGS